MTKNRPTSLNLSHPLRSVSLALVSLVSLACQSEKPPEPESVTPSAAAPAASAPAAASSSPKSAQDAVVRAHGTLRNVKGAAANAQEEPEVEISWTAPKEWKKETRKRMMRVATYQASGPKGDAEVAVFYFGKGQGGGIEANISRWIGQFKGLPKEGATRTTSEKDGMKRHTVSIQSGTFASGMPGAQKGDAAGWGLEGAIVEAPSGSYFFKMTGPSETVSAQRAALKKLLDSIKATAKTKTPSAKAPASATQPSGSPAKKSAHPPHGTSPH